MGIIRISEAGFEIIEGEIWKPVEGYEGRYRVSNHGRIWSTPTYQADRLLKPGTQSRGYLTVVLYDGSTPKCPRSFSVHRLVMSAFGGDPDPEQTQINHKDLDKSNNHIDNIEWSTPLANNQHAVANGRSARGEKNGKAKLSDEQVVEILQRLDRGDGTASIAKDYPVVPSYVRELRRGNYRPAAREMYANLQENIEN